MQKVSEIARNCGMPGTRIGALHGHPVLEIERRAMQSLNPLSPAWECFMRGISSGEFSDELGFIGSEARTP